MSRTFSCAALFLCVVLVSTLPFTAARAQFAIPQTASLVTITATPRSPAPFERVHLSVGAFSTGLSSPSWTVNGKAITPNSDGSIDIQMGAANEKITVTVTVSSSKGRESATRTLIPATIDLLVDSTSYTPPFFKGRPLASSGSVVRIQAIPHLGSAAAPIGTGNITFTWRKGGSVVASGRGLSTVALTGPSLFGSDTISVAADSVDGVYSASASIVLPGVDPKPLLYVDDPLTGVKYNSALQNESSLPDTEASLIAVPYFTDARSLRDARFVYDWSVNGQPLPNADVHSNEITINAVGSSGKARLSLLMTSSANFFIHSEQSWNLSLANASDSVSAAVAPEGGGGQ